MAIANWSDQSDFCDNFMENICTCVCLWMSMHTVIKIFNMNAIPRKKEKKKKNYAL